MSRCLTRWHASRTFGLLAACATFAAGCPARYGPRPIATPRTPAPLLRLWADMGGGAPPGPESLERLGDPELRAAWIKKTLGAEVHFVGTCSVDTSGAAVDAVDVVGADESARDLPVGHVASPRRLRLRCAPRLGLDGEAAPEVRLVVPDSVRARARNVLGVAHADAEEPDVVRLEGRIDSVREDWSVEMTLVAIDAGGRDVGNRMGSLDPAMIDSTFKENLARIQWCYETRLGWNQGLHGKIVVHFVIEKSGEVSMVSLKSSTMRDAVTERCVEKQFLRVKFPPPRGGGIVTVNYPLRFSTN